MPDSLGLRELIYLIFAISLVALLVAPCSRRGTCATAASGPADGTFPTIYTVPR